MVSEGGACVKKLFPGPVFPEPVFCLSHLLTFSSQAADGPESSISE